MQRRIVFITIDGAEYTLANEIRTDYTTHIASTTYHVAADATNTIASAASSTLATVLTLANEIKADYNAHLHLSGVHRASDTWNIVVSPDAQDAASVFTLLNEIKSKYNKHLADAHVHKVADTTDTIAAADAANESPNIDIGLKEGNALLVQLTGTTCTGTVDFQSSIDGATYSNTPYILKNSVTASKSVAQISGPSTATTYILLPPLTQVRIACAVTVGSLTVVYREIEYNRPFDGAADDEPIIFGGDVYQYVSSAGLAANTADSKGVIGTPVAQAIAANSFVLANITANGDIAFYGNLAGNSQQFLFYDTSAAILSLLTGKLKYSTGAFAFQGATTISSSTGILQIKTTDATLLLQNSVAQGITCWAGTAGTGMTFTLGGTTATDGQANDSPSLVLRAVYDADPAGGVTATNWNYTILHDMITAGATPKSQAIHSINDVNAFAMENNNGVITNFLYGKVDVWASTPSLLLGAVNSAVTRTDATQKLVRIDSVHYTNAEEAISILSLDSNSAYTEFSWGGGSGNKNCATKQVFYAAAAIGTLTGTEIFRITPAGLTIGEAMDFILGTTTGTKIGTATNQKLGFFNANPVVQQTGYAVPTDLTTCIAALTTLRTALNNLGLQTVV